MNAPRLYSTARLFLFVALVTLVVLVAPGLTPRAHAASLVVSSLADTGGGSLRDAITTANGNASADTITFSVSGTIYLNSALPTLTDANGLTIDGAGQTIAIDGSNQYQVFIVTAGPLTLKNLTIQHGNSTSTPGAAIYNSNGGGGLDITNVKFLNNQGYGAVASWTTSPSYVRNSTFSGNTKTVNNNSASALDAGLGQWIITNTVFANNSNPGVGGGTINLESSTYVVVIGNSTFSGNAPSQGVIFNAASGAWITLINSTFSGNTGTSTLYTISGAQTRLYNTIITNTTPGTNCATGGATGLPINLGNNIDDGTSCGFGSSNGSMSNTNPQLGALTNGVFPLNYNSPAIDAGDNTQCAGTYVKGVDQRGQARDDLACDIGAYEMNIADRNNVTLQPSSSTLTTYGPARVGIQYATSPTGTNPGVITATKVSNWTGGTPANTLGVWWELTAPTNTGLNLTLKLCYSTAELGSLVEDSTAHFWRYNGSWNDMGAASFSGTTPNKCAQISGITDLSRWTIANARPGNDAPTAVTLSSFKANAPTFDLGAWLRKMLGW